MGDGTTEVSVKLPSDGLAGKTSTIKCPDHWKPRTEFEMECSVDGKWNMSKATSVTVCRGECTGSVTFPGEFRGSAISPISPSTDDGSHGMFQCPDGFSSGERFGALCTNGTWDLARSDAIETCVQEGTEVCAFIGSVRIDFAKFRSSEMHESGAGNRARCETLVSRREIQTRRDRC